VRETEYLAVLQILEPSGAQGDRHVLIDYT